MITSAGISAGIDMALYLVSRLASPERARQVRDGIQYDPEPRSECLRGSRNVCVAGEPWRAAAPVPMTGRKPRAR
jgi:transcriptional regulator GlxA family with amidase domain